MPWPKEVEATASSFHTLGVSGRALSTSSTLAGSVRPKALKYCSSRLTPIASASLAVPMLDECWNTSTRVSTFRVAW